MSKTPNKKKDRAQGESPDHQDFATEETLVTPATGIRRDTDDSDLSTASVTGLDQEVTHEIPEDPQLRFGRFVTEGVIGKGGMGVVFKAVDPLIGRTVAIKALRTDTGIIGDSQDELRSRFELEFKSAGTLSHTNIVTIYDVGQEDDTTFIAMEFIDGKSLEQLLREGEVLSFERIGELVLGTCLGLDYAHRAGIVHRDVKPGNILIEPGSGTPKITDFGVAKVQSSGLTQTGTVIGTPAYMSPEQILGKDVSGRSDQFSAAVILYQMLTGKLPFGSDAPASILFRIVHNDPEAPHEINPDIPQAVSDVMAKALAKDPADRYETCAEMARAATAALLGHAPAIEESTEVDQSSFKSVTLSTTEPLRGSGTYAGAASWWQRQSAAPRVGLGIIGALLFAAIGWVAVANVMGRDPLPFVELPIDIPFLQSSREIDAPVAAAGAGNRDPSGTPPDGVGSVDPGAGSDAGTPADAEGNRDPAAVAGDAPADTTTEVAAAAVPRTYTIDSNPQGATVTLGGDRLEGTTPLEVDLTIGQTYEVRVSLDGYRPAGSRLTASADGNNRPFYTLNLDTKPGRITFARPEGYGNVILESGGSRLNPERVNPGVYQVTVKAPQNYLVLEPQQVTVLEDQATSITLPALIEVRVVGIGSGTKMVSIDGGAARQAPLTLWLQPGTPHRFSFTFDGGETRERQLMIGRSVSQVVGSVDQIITR